MAKIYNLKNGVIEVYGVIPQGSKLVDFRKRQAIICPVRERVLTQEKLHFIFGNKKFVATKGDYGLRKEDHDNSQETSDDIRILERYFAGEFSGNDVEKYTRKDGSTLYGLEVTDQPDKFIQISKDAYLLELLLGEKFTNKDLLRSKLIFLKDKLALSEEPIKAYEVKEVLGEHRSDLMNNSSSEIESDPRYYRDSTSVYNKMKRLGL